MRAARCPWNRPDSPAPASLRSQLGAKSPFQKTANPQQQTPLWFNIYTYESIPEKSTVLLELQIGHNLSNREPGILSAFNHWKKRIFQKDSLKKNRTQGKKMIIKDA